MIYKNYNTLNYRHDPIREEAMSQFWTERTVLQHDECLDVQ
jgi:hypothetical protein